MPRQGGQTTQSGILYQNSVAVLYLGDLCNVVSKPPNEQVVYVRLETPDKVDDIVVTFADDHRVYFQAKENIALSEIKWDELWGNVSKQYLSTDFDRKIDRLHLCFGRDKALFNNLKELCIRALNSNSYDDWMNQCALSQKELLEKLKKILPPELLIQDLLPSFFACIDVSIMSLQHIERDISPSRMPATNRKPREVFRLLRDRVGGEARVGGGFNSVQLKDSLKNESPDLIFYDPPDVEQLLSDARKISSLLLQHKHTFGSTGLYIKRSIVSEILQWLENRDDIQKNVAILVDQAGMGKTVVMQDILRNLEDKKIVTIAIKADQQLQDVSNFSELQSAMNLVYPLDQIVERISKLGPVVVLIDQIDALSLTLANDVKTLNFTLDLVAKLRRIPNVRIVISCRLFDRNTDPRLRQLEVDRQFSLSFLTNEEIRSVTNSLGIDFSHLSSATQTLLQTPLNLNLFSLAVAEGNVSVDQVRGINSLQELYGVIWQNVIFIPDSGKIPSKAERKEAIDALVSYMNTRQSTVVTRTFFYESDKQHLEKAIDWLLSTGILVDTKSNLSFLHQTFFDYCFARKFVDEGKNIVDEILNSPQGLFDRSRLVQVVAYLREYDLKLYLSNYAELLSSTKLRFHLQDLLIRWFAALSNPKDDEWLHLYRSLLQPDKRTHYLLALQGNAVWFDRLKGEGIISKWLSNESPDFIDNHVMYYLHSLVDNRQKEVAELLLPYVDKDIVWLNRLLNIFMRVRNWSSNEASELLEKTIYRLPSINRHAWHEVKDLAKAFPKIGCRLMLYAFDYNEKETGDNSQRVNNRFGFGSNLDKLNSSSFDDVIKTISAQEPELFLQKIIPWVLDSMGEATPDPLDGQDLLFEWDVFCNGWNLEYHEVRNALVFGIIESLVNLENVRPDEVQKYIALFMSSAFITPQRIVARVFTANPKAYSNRALEFLLKDQRRLQLGENSQFDSRQLISAIYPFLSSDQKTELENFILNYHPIHKRWKVRGLNSSGLEQLYLLQSIPELQLSVVGLKRLRELERKFPGEKAPAEERMSRGGFVSSPIPMDIALKMSDRSWLAAMQKYKGAKEHKDIFKGGASQLSVVLTELIKQTPARFYKMLDFLPERIDENYARAFIQGLSESNADPEWVFNAIRRFIPSISQEYRRNICWVLEKRNTDMPSDLIEWLQTLFYASSSDDEWRWVKGEDHRDVFSAYLNSDRGAAFNALMRYYQQIDGGQAITERWRLIELAGFDASTALRAGAVYELIFMIRYDKLRAIELFEKIISGHEVLLTLMHTREFLYWSFSKNFLRLSPYITAMINSEIEKVRNQGAQLACIALISRSALESDEAVVKAKALVEQVVVGDVNMRRGAATVFSHNLANYPLDACEEYLKRLLNDEDEEVQGIVDRVFSGFEGEHVFSKKEFIEEYARSRRVIDLSYADFMLNYGILDPRWAIEVIDSQINNIDLINRGWRHSGVDELIRLVLKIYTNANEDELREKSMNIFDELLKRFAGSAHKVLLEWDRA